MVDRAVSRKRYAVVMVTYGEVERLTIRNLWPTSRRIVKVITSQIVRLPDALIYFVADFRSVKHYIDWKYNRYQSSLVAINRAQKEAVARELPGHLSLVPEQVDIEFFDAYYFVPPYFDDMLSGLQHSHDGVIVVPMIPVESAFSCGVACRMLMDVYAGSMFGKTRVMRNLWNDRELHQIYTDYLFDSLSAGMRKEGAGKKGLVLVIHGTLVRDRAGNPPKVFTGLEETLEFFGLMSRKIMADPRNIFDGIKLGCFNHATGGTWMAETFDRALFEFREDGYDSVAMFPFGFFADNSETEYEAKKQLDRSSFPVKQYIPCINDSRRFAGWLASKIAGEIAALSRLQGAVGRSESSMPKTEEPHD